MIIQQTWAERLRELDDTIARCLNIGVTLIQECAKPEYVHVQVDFLHNLMRRRECMLNEAMRLEGLSEADLMKEARAGGA